MAVEGTEGGGGAGRGGGVGGGAGRGAGRGGGGGAGEGSESSPMSYAHLARAYSALEGTTKRLEMTDILIRLFLDAAPEELDRLVYLTLGKLGPDFEGVELGMADKLVLKAVAENGGVPQKQVERMLAQEGDIGAVAQKVLGGGRQATLFSYGAEGSGEGGGTGAGGGEGGPLMVADVFDALHRVADKKDKDAQSKKTEIVKGLLNRANELEARYLVRTLVGKLRLGARDMTILDALAYAFHPALDEEPAKLQARAAELMSRTLALADECGAGSESLAALEGPARGLGNTLAGLTGLLRAMEGRTTSLVYAGVEGAEATMKASRPLTRAAGKVPDEGEDDDRPLVRVHRNVREVEELAALVEGLKAKVEEGRELLERGYILTSDLGEVARTMAADGLGATGQLKMMAGVPVRSMLAERLGSVEEILEKMGGTAAFEYKYDGLRVQAHITPGGVRLFSRNLEEITGQFPDLVERFGGAAGAGEAIVDGECLPVDPDTGEVLPFQVVSRRRGRKYGLATGRYDGSLDGETGSTFEDEFPVVVVLFDILLKDGEPLMDLPYPERRKRLEEAFGAVKNDGVGEESGGEGDGGEGSGGEGSGKDGSGPDAGVRLSTQMVTSDPAEAAAFFDASLAEGCEGVVAKSVADDSYYRAGARGWQWIKLKRDYRSEMTDTADLVVVGAFHGKGRRTGFYGALLMACRDPGSGKYETVCKLGTGFTDEALAQMKELLAPHLTGGSGETRPASVDSRMEPEVWFDPAVLLEVAGAELTLSPVHTCAMGKYREDSGLAIRFPRYTGRLRDDKSPEDATTTAEMSGMYERQLKKV